jgi:hypothetical protein
MFGDDDGLSGLYGSGSQSEHDGELEGHWGFEARPDSPDAGPGTCEFGGGQHDSQLGNPQQYNRRTRGTQPLPRALLTLPRVRD